MRGCPPTRLWLLSVLTREDQTNRRQAVPHGTKRRSAPDLRDLRCSRARRVASLESPLGGLQTSRPQRETVTVSMRCGGKEALFSEEWIRTLAQAFGAESGVYVHHGFLKSIVLPGVRRLGRDSPSSGLRIVPPSGPPSDGSWPGLSIRNVPRQPRHGGRRRNRNPQIILPATHRTTGPADLHRGVSPNASPL